MNHREWFDQMASKWDTMLTEDIIARLRGIIASADIQPGAKVLDLGCGTGVLFPMLLEKVGRDGLIIGLDISAEMLRLARRKGYNVHCVQGDGQSLPLTDQTLDWVICNSALPHFPDEPAALRETRRVLKPGGRLLICHPKGRETVNAIHQSIGEPIANDIIPAEAEMFSLLAAADLDCATICDQPNRYVVLTSRMLSPQPSRR